MEYKQLSQTQWLIKEVVEGKVKEIVFDFPPVINQMGWDFENRKKVSQENGSD